MIKNTSLVAKRESNIELLRIIAILMVICIHLYQQDVPKILQNKNIFINFLYSFSLCAVNIFLIISGYFSVLNKRCILGKPFELILISTFFNTAYYLSLSLLFGDFEWISFFRTLIPNNYFVNIFCVCYCLSPYINNIFLHETKKNLALLMMISFFFFSIWPTIANTLLLNIFDSQLKGIFPIGLSGTDQGFTLVNFIFCYITIFP